MTNQLYPPYWTAPKKVRVMVGSRLVAGICCMTLDDAGGMKYRKLLLRLGGTTKIELSKVSDQSLWNPN